MLQVFRKAELKAKAVANMRLSLKSKAKQCFLRLGTTQFQSISGETINAKAIHGFGDIQQVCKSANT